LLRLLEPACAIGELLSSPSSTTAQRLLFFALSIRVTSGGLTYGEKKKGDALREFANAHAIAVCC
jgi:hypothetical protein